jgi:DUF917 family protein
MRKLDENHIVDVIWGATLLGSGGGGSKKWGEAMLEAYRSAHPGVPIGLDLIGVAEMDEKSFAAAAGGLGEPSAIKGDFSPFVNNAFAALTAFLKQRRKNADIAYSLAVELGGFNTFAAMLIALERKIPLIDSDCCARAVPALETTLFSVNGNAICPLGMADDRDRTRIITAARPKDARMAERTARKTAVDFGGIAGIAGWLVRKKAVRHTLPARSISLCGKAGAVLRDTGLAEGAKWDALSRIVPCRRLCAARIAGGAARVRNGFDEGYVVFKDDRSDAEYAAYFQNETLLIAPAPESGQAPVPLMTAPDCVAVFNAETGEPLTNADLFENGTPVSGLPVSVGLVKVDGKWWKAGIRRLEKAWAPHFSAACPGYSGGIVPYKPREAP